MRELETILLKTRQLISASRETVTTTCKSLNRTVELISKSRAILGIGEGNGMDRALALKHLRPAEDHIVEGEYHINRQRRIIAELERDGHDTALAKNLLEIFEETLANHLVLRDHLVEELRQDNAAAENGSIK